MPLGRPFDGFVEHSKRVSPTCLVHFERNRYSVPASFANRPVSVRIYPAADRRCRRGADPVRACAGSSTDRITAGANDLRLAALSGGDPAQARRVAQRRALRRNARRASGACRAICSSAPGGDREMVEILALVLQHDEQAVLCAVELALEAGVPTKTHILNLLHRLVDGKADKRRQRSMPRRRWPCAGSPRPMSNATMRCAAKEVRHAS